MSVDAMSIKLPMINCMRTCCQTREWYQEAYIRFDLGLGLLPSLVPSSTHHVYSSPELRTFCSRDLWLHLEPMGSNLRHGPESSGICIKKSKMYRNISKSFKIYSKSSSNRPKISRNFMEFLDSSIFLPETMVHIATPGCTDPWHLQLRVLPLFHIQRQDEQLDQAGQRPRCLNWCFSTMGVLPKSGGGFFASRFDYFRICFMLRLKVSCLANLRRDLPSG